MTAVSPAPAALLSVEDALGRLVATVPGPLPAESVAVAAALDRVLAGAVRSETDLPRWDNSAMDGYAVRSADLENATDDAPVRLRVVGEARAGSAASASVGEGGAIRIATGAPLPPGADAVVPVEDTTPIAMDGSEGRRGLDAAGPPPAECLVHRSVQPGQHVRRRGDDLRAGSEVIPAGRRIRPADVALAAGVGKGSLDVRRRPRVAVLSTGDELRLPGESLGDAGIPDANRPGLIALLRAAGAETLDLGVARDDLVAVLGALRPALPRADAIVVSGGVSVGPYDVVRAAFAELGRIDLWRVAVQPGKPFAFGLAERPVAAGSRTTLDGAPQVLLFGLPGNPVSTFVTFELFVRPVLDRMLGAALDRDAPLAALRADRGVLLEPVRKAPARRAYVRVRAEREPGGDPARDPAGRVRLVLAGGQGSHVLSALAAADGLAVVPETTDHLEAGSEVVLHWLDRT